MDINKLFDNNEKPLDNLLEGSGFCGIFRTIGVVGDSLSSGEFETRSANGVIGYHDFYEYSWGQYMAREIGCKVYNFSRGGMTAKEFCTGFGRECGAWDYDKLCQAYIVALGCNDMNCAEDMGDATHITPTEWGMPETFAGYYTQIIRRLSTKAPDAKFFLVTQPRCTDDEERRAAWKADTAELIRDVAARVPNTYVIDLHKYAPVIDDKFREMFYLGCHMNTAGYLLISRMMMSYMDYIIRHNITDFRQAGFINTIYKYSEK